MKREIFPEQLSYAHVATRHPSVLFEYFKTSPHGLATEDIVKRCNQYGSNRVSKDESRWYHILWNQCTSSFVYLLIIASLLSALIGDTIEASMIGAFVCINVALGFFQEMRALKARSHLRKYIQRHARVLRDGAVSIVGSEQVTVGDILIIGPGDILPADGVWLSAQHLELDESVLSGESLSITKNTQTPKRAPTNYFKASNIGFSQTKVVAGKGTLLVTAIGDATVAGSLFSKTNNKHEPSEFEHGIQRLGAMLFAVVSITIILLVILKILFQHETNAVELAVFGIALVVGVVPEALPFVTTFSMSRGAIRLAKKGVIIKRLSVIEDLGGVDILCADKTGTLTENKMTVASIWGNKKEVLSWARYSAWDSDTQRFKEDTFTHALVKDMTQKERESCTRLMIEYSSPFDPITRTEQTTILEHGKKLHILKGVPEIFFLLLSEKEREGAQNWLKEEGQKGRRVVAVAIARGEHISHSHMIAESDFVGMISFEDSLKRNVKAILAQAHRLGIKVMIVSGDAPDVVGYVAEKVGLIKDRTSVITGDEFSAMNARAQALVFEKPVAFARMMPLQKLEVIEHLKQQGHIVGFLGDGFNDAPALRLAHVGLAVNNASEMAKDSAPIILTSKDFGPIIDGIQEGRHIFANTITYIRATLTSNLGNFYALIFATLTLPYLPMLTVQILLLNLFTDGPMIAIAADRDGGVAQRRPQRYHVRDILVVAFILGLVSTVFDFAFFGYFVGHGKEILRTMWFMGSVFTELVLLFSIRTLHPIWRARAPAPVLVWSSGVAVFLTIILPFTTIGHDWLGFTTPNTHNMVVVGALVVGYFVVTEIVKLFIRRFMGEVKKK
ncbi:MAG: cation-transporting P-type ATPase [bacterium]|nr:cation-transporting P-type ATPase [bacterium]